MPTPIITTFIYKPGVLVCLQYINWKAVTDPEELSLVKTPNR